jgi:hypothetical protein
MCGPPAGGGAGADAGRRAAARRAREPHPLERRRTGGGVTDAGSRARARLPRRARLRGRSRQHPHHARPRRRRRLRPAQARPCCLVPIWDCNWSLRSHAFLPLQGCGLAAWYAAHCRAQSGWAVLRVIEEDGKGKKTPDRAASAGCRNEHQKRPLEAEQRQPLA